MERVYECGGASGAINTPIQWLREEGGDSAHGRPWSSIECSCLASHGPNSKTPTPQTTGEPDYI